VRVTAVSILMPCLDPGPYLRAALGGVLAQLGPEDELVVQDACSTDGSAALLDRTAAADERVRVVHERDRGQSDALNRALARCRGELVGWLNADDLLLPGALAAVRRAVEPAPADLVLGGWQVRDAAGTVLRQETARPLSRLSLLLHGCYVFSGAMLVDRALLRSVGGFREDLHFTMDFDLMLRLAGAASRQVVLGEPIGALRLHATSKSGAQHAGFARDAIRVRREQARGVREAATAVAGTAYHLAAVASHELRFGPTWGRLRGHTR
jgi:glycosyltransferase involved in cell wall biosynthesis